MKKSNEISLPKIRQIGVVVKNVDKTIEYYTSNFGIGPFNVITVNRKSAIIHGKKVDYKVKLAFTDLGNIQLELIEVLEGETIQTEFLRESGEGLHHLGFLVNDLDFEILKWKKKGIGVLQRSKPGTPGYAYMDTAKISGVIFELIQPRLNT